MRIALALLLGAFASLFPGATAQAAVVSCSGEGLTYYATAQYGTCETDMNGGSGSVAFVNDGIHVTSYLAAKTQRGDEQVAASVSSWGPVEGTPSQVCVLIQVTDLALKGTGTLQERYTVTYRDGDGNVQFLTQTRSVTSAGDVQAYCLTVPVGATNIWWGVLSIATGTKPMGQVGASVYFAGAYQS